MESRLNRRAWLAGRSRQAAADWLTAVLLSGLVFRTFGAALEATGSAPWPRLSVAVALSVPVALRRRCPVPVLGVLLAVSLLLTALGLPPGAWAFLPVALALYQVAAGGSLLLAACALGAGLTSLATTSVVMLAGIGSPGESAVNLASSTIAAALALAVGWALGYAVQQRRARTEQIREQQARLVQRELEQAWRAVTEERLRIARELHDVVAHSMSVIAVQAGVGHHVIGTQPDEARAALAAIHATAGDALAEMRHLLGVLRQEGHDPDRDEMRPAPALSDLDRLAAQTARAGVDVDIQVTGHRRRLAAGIELSAYRIVQEALTNVVKHARTATCRVRLDYGERELGIEVTDHGNVAISAPRPAPGQVSPRAAPAGHGIVGMRERVSLYRGEFRAGPMPGNGFRVAARIPLSDGGR
jgi:signal transduction histidine kinase